MAIQYSDLATRQRAKRFDPILPRDFRGRVRVMAGALEVKEEGTQFVLGYLPAGEVRVLGGQSSLSGNITTGTTTLTIGLGTYMPIKGGAAVPADEDALQVAKKLAETDFAASSGAGVTYSSANEVPVTVKTSANLVAGDKINFSILYVVD